MLIKFSRLVVGIGNVFLLVRGFLVCGVAAGLVVITITLPEVAVFVVDD